MSVNISNCVYKGLTAWYNWWTFRTLIPVRDKNTNNCNNQESVKAENLNFTGWYHHYSTTSPNWVALSDWCLRHSAASDFSRVLLEQGLGDVGQKGWADTCAKSCPPVMCQRKQNWRGKFETVSDCTTKTCQCELWQVTFISESELWFYRTKLVACPFLIFICEDEYI